MYIYRSLLVRSRNPRCRCDSHPVLPARCARMETLPKLNLLRKTLGENCAQLGVSLTGSHHARRKTPRVLPALFANKDCKTSRFRNSPGAKLKGFAPLAVISTSNRNCNTRPRNTLRIATQKPPMQNPSKPERQTLLHRHTRNPNAKPTYLRTSEPRPLTTAFRLFSPPQVPIIERFTAERTARTELG